MVTDRQTLGERWKRQRERQGVTLEAIARKTKIPTSLFANLERGDCSRWPAGLYSRAYIRAYAQAISINAEEAVDDFLAAFGGSLPDGTAIGPARAAKPAKGLRLAMVDDPGIDLGKLVWRIAYASMDLAISLTLAWIAHGLLGAGVWTTVGAALAYCAIGRVVSDDPLPVWLFKRSRGTPTPAPTDPPSEVAVGDAASTTA